MWSRKKDEEFSPKPAYTPPGEQPREGMPASSPAVRTETDYRSGSQATIGKSVIIKGQIYSREDLFLDGEFEGTVELQEHRLTIGPNGKVQANVKAREIVIIGTIHGNIDASDKVEIRKEARLVGDIRTTRISIDDGAYFKGSIDIQKADVTKQQAAAAAPKVKADTPPAAPGGGVQQQLVK
jgi:cytoskeletal protein CcmA (bactofilin family)